MRDLVRVYSADSSKSMNIQINRITPLQWELGIICREFREEVRTDKRNMARLIGVSEDRYEKYERGSERIPVEEYCKALLKIDEFIRRKERKKLYLLQFKKLKTSDGYPQFLSSDKEGNIFASRRNIKLKQEFDIETLDWNHIGFTADNFDLIEIKE